MSRRRGFLIFFLLAAILSGWLLFELVSSDSEPVYKGKLFSDWLEQYRTNCIFNTKAPEVAQKRNEAKAAILQIGTNSLPILLRMVRTYDSPLKIKLLSLAQKQHFIKLALYSDDFYHAKASFGFGALGPVAKPLMPALIESLKDKNEGVRNCAANCVASMGRDGRDAVPQLLALLDDRHNPVGMVEAMMALGAIGEKPEITVPKLLEFVNGDRKDWNFGVMAIRALRGYGTKAKAASPALQQLLQDPDPNLRNEAINALFSIDPDALKARGLIK